MIINKIICISHSVFLPLFHQSHKLPTYTRNSYLTYTFMNLNSPLFCFLLKFRVLDLIVLFFWLDESRRLNLSFFFFFFLFFLENPLWEIPRRGFRSFFFLVVVNLILSALILSSHINII